MKRLSLGSFIVTALALGVLAVGCGDDDDPTPRGSGEGESCVRSSDCESGLACISNFCTSGGSGEGGSDTGPAPGPVLGAEGESCGRRADCESGLLCIDQRCVSSAPADGGEGNTPAPRLGARGDGCESVSDCAPGLTCILRGGGSVCDLENYGLEPTGNVCGGECLEAEDCCEMPPTIAGTYGSCENLLQTHIVNLTTNCPARGTPALGFESLCFLYRTYCECAATTWDCTENRCSYTARCTVSGATTGGCATQTRTGAALNPTCSVDNACSAAAEPCGNAADCEGQLTADLGTTCVEDECVCAQERCYRGCDEDLDCPALFSCVEGACTATSTCVTDAQCAINLDDATAECRDGSCVIPCTRDQDCSDSGEVGGGDLFDGTVCGPDNTCQQLGCSEDDECTSGLVRTFCIEAPAPAAERVRSAITD